jgi:hypothetical protein
LGSAIAVDLAGLFSVFNSVFLFVTDAFNVSGAGFAAALDEGFAFDTVATFAFAAVFGAVLAAVFVGALFGVFALPADLTTTGFLAAGFIDLLEAGLVAADFAFFAAGVVFAGFFIAFAMESIPTLDCSRCAKGRTHAEPINICTLHWLGIRPRDIPENSRLSRWDSIR